MGIKLKYQGATGETRRWTLKEIAQGKPLDRPTHPMVIHFPIAFYTGARVRRHVAPGAPPVGSARRYLADPRRVRRHGLAVPTGLVDGPQCDQGLRLGWSRLSTC